METRTVYGTCRQGKSGSKLHFASATQTKTEEGSMDRLKCGEWATTDFHCSCTGQRNRGGTPYWGFQVLESKEMAIERCTCKDCKPA